MAMNVDRLRALRQGPRDGALLRLTLGNALLDAGQINDAVTELRQALLFNPAYSAAWKALGKALLAGQQPADAAKAWHRGLHVARAQGDRQAEKEMTVFLKRLSKS